MSATTDDDDLDDKPTRPFSTALLGSMAPGGESTGGRALPSSVRRVGLVLAGKYQLEFAMKQGGMGAVWKAQHLDLGVPVAVKLMHSRIAASEEARTRFTREAKAAAQIRSSNVVQVLDYGVDNGMPYIVMEMLEGEDLAARLERVGRLSLEETIAILAPIGRALDRAHQTGLVHRDLKPANLFLAREGEHEVPKILDFGIAKALGGDRTEGGETTQEGEILGSPHYMSPEQARSRADIDHRTDIWSLGCIAYRALTGRKPFDDGPTTAILLSICTDPIPSASSLVRGLPPGIDAFFDRALARDRDQRFASAKDFLRALQTLLLGHADVASGDGAAGGPLSARTRLEESGSRAVAPTSVAVAHSAPDAPRRWVAPVVGIAVAALGAIAFFVARSPSEPEKPTATDATAREPAGDPVRAPPAAVTAAPSAASEAAPIAASASATSAVAASAPAVAPPPLGSAKPPPPGKRGKRDVGY